MSPESTRLFSREEILGGLPAGRATSLLFAIENRTAVFVSRSRRAMAWYRTERTDAQRERAFFDALADGRAPPVKPSIQDIDRYAPAWADLVPPDAALRAELAHQLGEKYRFTPERAAGLRSALSLDDPAVDAAHRRLHDAPLTSVYAERLTLGERLAWARAELAYRLENLPPFWTAFSLTLTGIIGGGAVALPIALAGIGPVAGIGLLLVFGLVNAITIVALVEAITRTGSMRYGSSYFARLVEDLLGRVGSVTLTVALLMLGLFLVFALATGFSSVLASATGIPAWAWVAVLFAIVMWMLRGDPASSTVASALVVGAVNLALMISLVALGVANLRPELMARGGIPPFDGRPFDASIVALVFGVVLSAYFGHSSAGNAAKLVLRREPSGRSFLWGSLSAMLVAIVVYCGVVLAVNGSVPPERLLGFEGTAITPLAEVAGPAVTILGAMYVVLAMGMVTINMCLGLYNQAGELLEAWAERGTGPARPIPAWVAALLRVAPIVAIFAVLELMLLTGGASFAGPLSIVGALTVPLVGGAFPMLLLAASRRRGEYVPGTAWRILGTAPVIWGVFALYVLAVVLHGIVIWQTPVERVLALGAGLVILAVAIAAWRGGSFRARTVVELRRDEQSDQAAVAVVASGRPIPADVRINGDGSGPADGVIADARSLRSVELTLAGDGSREVKVWAHRLTAAGESDAWPVAIEATGGDGEMRRFEIGGRDESASVVMPRDGRPLTLRLTPTPSGRKA